MQFNDIKDLLKEDFEKVDHVIKESLQSKINLIHELGRYIVQSGGKRIRPLLVLLSAHAAGYTGHHHITLAAIIEIVHTATLLHDDVVDAAELRRGKETANRIWGNEAAVLVGDFLYSKAFQLLIQVETPEIMKVLADSTNQMAEGEALQLEARHKPETNEGEYLNIIRAKTAKLFEASALLGGLLSRAKPTIVQALGQYGLHLGTAFQLMDDILDYQGNPTEIGKALGTDLKEGKVTLPLIYLLQNGSTAEVRLIRDAIQTGGTEKLLDIQRLIESSKALEYTKHFAKVEVERAEKALLILPDSPYKTAALALAQFAYQRTN